MKAETVELFLQCSNWIILASAQVQLNRGLGFLTVSYKLFACPTRFVPNGLKLYIIAFLWETAEPKKWFDVEKKIIKTIFQLYLTVSIHLKYSSSIDTWSKLVVESYIALNEDRWV